jgi:hypothetical protein
MTSVPEARAGLGSAINNAISRVGPQLAGALIFVAVTGAFYADLSSRVPTLDTSSPTVRMQVPPLNQPDPSVSPQVSLAAHDSSTDAFRLAMAISAGLLLLGAAVNAVGISDGQAKSGTDEAAVATGSETESAAAPAA